MTTIVLGDIHGRKIWKDIVAKETSADRIIFIGDYFDSFDIPGVEQLDNFNEIIGWVRGLKWGGSKQEVILLTGNHDASYTKGFEESCSGFQPRLSDSFELALSSAKDELQMCFVDENDIVFSHAGFTRTFLRESIGYSHKFGKKEEELVNELWKTQPRKFNFYWGDRSGYGDNKHQSCIWVRPQSLYADQISNLQVVGHTGVEKINHPQKSERRGFYMIDTFHNNNNKQYLKIIDGNITIETI